MIDPLEFLRALRSRGVTYFAGVPDSLLQNFCACVAEHAGPNEHLIAADEGGAVAAAVGYHLATAHTPLVYMQNSGLGNAVNPLLSLADSAVCGIPMLLLIGWRGEPGTHDEPQHVKQGAVTLALLDAMQLPYTIIDARTTELDAVIVGALQSAQAGQHALVVRNGTFGPYHPRASSRAVAGLRREEVIAQIADSLDANDLVVATTGMIARELHAHRTGRGQGHERDFLVVGGMGHASQIAHTLAAHQSSRQVYCLDGDAAVLMHMGALAIIGASRLANFRHIVLNNGAHESVGGQPTVALGLDLPALARSVGYAAAARVETPDELRRGLHELREGEAPALLEVRIALGHRADLERPAATPAENKKALMKDLR